MIVNKACPVCFGTGQRDTMDANDRHAIKAQCNHCEGTGNISTVESPEARLHRLAETARNAGLRILEYAPTNEAYCTSRSEPDRLHRVTFISCDCKGFVNTGACSHFALFLWSRNALPPLPATIVTFRPRLAGSSAA